MHDSGKRLNCRNPIRMFSDFDNDKKNVTHLMIINVHTLHLLEVRCIYFHPLKMRNECNKSRTLTPTLKYYSTVILHAYFCNPEYILTNELKYINCWKQIIAFTRTCMMLDIIHLRLDMLFYFLFILDVVI